jgi:hypothetical protein
MFTNFGFSLCIFFFANKFFNVQNLLVLISKVKICADFPAGFEFIDLNQQILYIHRFIYNKKKTKTKIKNLP